MKAQTQHTAQPPTMPQTKLYDKNSFKKFRRLAQKPASPMAKIRRPSTKNLIETAIKFKIQEPRDKELITHFFKPKIKTSLSKLPKLLEKRCQNDFCPDVLAKKNYFDIKMISFC